MQHNCPWCGKPSDVTLPTVDESQDLKFAHEKISELELDISLLQVAHGKALADLTTQSSAPAPIPVPDLETAQHTADTIIAGMTLTPKE